MIRDDLTGHCQILHTQTSGLLQYYYYQTNFWLLGDYTRFMESLGVKTLLQCDSYSNMTHIYFTQSPPQVSHINIQLLVLQEL